MDDPKTKAEALRQRQLASLRKAADEGVFTESWFGRYVAAALANGDELSRAGLRAWLESQLAAADTAAHDPFRPFIEAALNTVDDAARRSSSST